MTKEFKAPEGHEMVSFEGTKLIPQPSVTEKNWWGHPRSVEQPPLEKAVVETTFPAHDLPNFDSYHVKFKGEFELLGVYFFTTTSQYATREVWTVAYCQLLNRPGEEWAAVKLSFQVDPNAEKPQLIRYETYEKKSGGDVRLVEMRGVLIFPSQADMTRLVKSLEPGNSITVAKLSSVE